MKKKNESKTTIILGIILCLLMIINIMVYINKNEVKPTEKTNETNNTTTKATVKTEEEQKEEEIAILKTLGERDRMERYFGNYVGYIEEQEYTKAYNLLNQEFKQNYFKTIEEYTKYIGENYPEMMSVEYTNIERQGQYYVLFVKITDLLGRTDDAKTLEQKIVVYEKDYNDFELSFSV